ncbi:hypothetical protein K440DRAFT_74874 [Wilcoxina mikolae CBS 423.85]|nr:hypothetical protein K440DRAFT_74874 [Wilcoxina mikolae CBS 423.85]
MVKNLMDRMLIDWLSVKYFPTNVCTDICTYLPPNAGAQPADAQGQEEILRIQAPERFLVLDTGGKYSNAFALLKCSPLPETPKRSVGDGACTSILGTRGWRSNSISHRRVQYLDNGKVSKVPILLFLQTQYRVLFLYRVPKAPAQDTGLYTCS